MIRRSTWALLAAFVLLLGGTILWTRVRQAPKGATGAGAEPTLTPLWSVPATDILGLRLEDAATGAVLELRRGDEQTPWRMVAPAEGPADAGRVEWAISALLSPRPTGTIPAPTDLAPYGLAKPGRQVTVFFKGELTRSFAVGRISPTGGVFYIKVPGQADVVLLSEYSLSDVLSLLDDPPFPPTATPSETPSPEPTGTPTPAGN